MNTTHASSDSAPADRGLDQRFLWRVLFSIGGVYLAVKLFRGLGQLFWTMFGLAMGLVWMFDDRLLPW
ncbi:hypothetical protein J2X02_000567 [Pseudoxanthomonas japonensis]|uniref:hypothetical protein n=1 Tax=Pseudoxanthomonas TaxID=83618 RepID=UPI000785EB89|nr:MULTISPECIES: hypothetical protein [Pseudoxanthomonas]MBA3930338.1 hypothetical protein [Xanthomonas sp.]MBL8255345.1 hypothetical protein [Pseudoxanthomonas mexicana]MDR7067750.1 hypothetical protein [Pseudoxanthomonas japonensis]